MLIIFQFCPRYVSFLYFLLLTTYNDFLLFMSSNFLMIMFNHRTICMYIFFKVTFIDKESFFIGLGSF